VKAERLSVVRNPKLAIEPFFDLHMSGPNRVVNLIELSSMCNGEVLPQAASCFET
jgi:hypothetical protein